MGQMSVYAYLQEFDVQDLDLRRAPTGGWHGTYRHDLASGVNHRNTNTRTKQKRSKFWIESGTLSDEEEDNDYEDADDDDDDANTTKNGGGGVDDAWAKTRLAQLGSSQTVMASLFADAGTGGNYHGISIEDHDMHHEAPASSGTTTAFGEKAVIHLV